MADRSTTLDDHSAISQKLLKVLEEFIDEIGKRNATSHFEKVLTDKYRLKGKHVTQQPERFIEEHLVFPILRDVLGHSIQTRPKQYAPRWPRKSGVPDFAITTIPIATAKEQDLRVFGEVKAPKKIQNARDDMTEYLEHDIDLHAVAFLTDGFQWELWTRSKGASIEELDNPLANFDLRYPLKAVQARNKDVEPYSPYDVRNHIEKNALSHFTADAVNRLVRQDVEIDFD